MNQKGSPPVQKPIYLWAVFAAILIAGAVAYWRATSDPDPFAEATAFHRAARDGRLWEVRAWVNENRAAHKPILTDEDLAIALCEAACHGRERVVEELLKSGVSPNAHPSGGCGALNDAACNPDAVGASRALIDAGADVNSPDRYGRTPLMEAIESGDVAMARLFLDSGADTTVVDIQGKTAVMLAEESKNPELIDLVRRHARGPQSRPVLSP